MSMKLVSLSIFNFRKIKENIKNILLIVLIVGFCLLGGGIFNYLLLDDTSGETGNWQRAMLHDFYTNAENIDRLYLGSSHVYCNIQPQILDDLNGKNNFNLSTPGQPFIISYYLLKEAIKLNELEHVYLEMYYLPGIENEDVIKTRCWDVQVQMPVSLNKIDFMLHTSELDSYPITFFKSRRFHNKLFDGDYIKNIVKVKGTKEYTSCDWKHQVEDALEYYVDKGFFYSEYTINPDVPGQNETARKMENLIMKESSLKYLHKIIELCQKERIGITLFCAPMSDSMVGELGNYDRYVNQIREIADKYKINYYDFNLCNSKYLDLSENSLWRDNGHLNVYGSEFFTPFLNAVFEMELKNIALPMDMFYHSCEGKDKS